MNPLQLTFAILKPHIIKHPISFQQIQNTILLSKFKIVKSKVRQITHPEASAFYEEHKDKFFYNRLITFMTSGPSGLFILARENAISEWRRLMGPTKVYRAQFEAPDTIRGRYGLSDTRNATHGSDSPEAVRREIQVFFPDFDVDKWYQNAEPLFRKNSLQFCKEHWVHIPVGT